MTDHPSDSVVAQALKEPHGMVLNGKAISRVNVLQVGNECAPPPRPGSDERRN